MYFIIRYNDLWSRALMLNSEDQNQNYIGFYLSYLNMMVMCALLMIMAIHMEYLSDKQYFKP